MNKSLLLLFLFVPFYLNSQNLVPNPSFEDYSTCPLGFDKITTAAPWNPARVGGSTDLYNICSNDKNNAVPAHLEGYQWPRTGNGFAGILAFSLGGVPSGTYREYLQVELISPLISGRKYIVVFFTALANRSNSSIKDLGAYISKTSLKQTDYAGVFFESGYGPNTYSNITVQPQIINNNNAFLEDTINWMKIKGEYVAQGNEKYLIIGNFKNDQEQERNVISHQSYYYIDDVSIYECTKLVELGNDTTACFGEPYIINAYTEGATYNWNDNSKNSTLNVISPGLYYVDVYLNGCHTRDSIRVSFKNPTLDLGRDTVLCKGDTIKLKAKNSGSPFTWSNGSSEGVLSISTSGKYWLTAYSNGCKRTDTIFVDFEELISLDLGKDTILCSGDFLILNPNNPELSYIWSDNSTSVIYEIKAPGTYSVEIHGKACVMKDTIHVLYYDCPTDIPNVITPNGDSKNDSFIVKEINYDSWTISICNRWGNEVYSNNDYKNDWRGENISGGVYFYTLRNKTNKRTYKGWIQVLK